MKRPAPLRPLSSSASTAPTGAKELLSPKSCILVGALLTIAVFVIYSPALHFQFILDDHRFTGDPRLQSSGHLWEYFTSFVWAQVPGGPVSFYRPLFLLWLRLNFLFTGASPWGWHLLSIAKHASVAALLGLLVWKLLRDRVAALMAAALFALHPAQTESVAWVTVPDPLMSFAALAAVFLFLGYLERAAAPNQLADDKLGGKSNKKSRKQPRRESKDDTSLLWLIASALACLGALMSKETAVVLPVVLFALALFQSWQKPAGEKTSAIQSPEFSSRLLRPILQTLPFLLVTILYFLLRFFALGGQLTTLTQHLPWTTVLLSWPATLWFYVKVLFWPVRSRAFADPSIVDAFSFRAVVLPGLGVLLVSAMVAALCFWIWKTARRNLPGRGVAGVERALLLGVLFLVLPLLLTLNLNALNPCDFLHGRYTYLPLAGLMLVLSPGWHLAGKNRSVLLAAAGAIAVAFAVLSIQQESIWKDDLTVFTVAHELAPHNAPVAQSLVRAHVQVALDLDDADRCDEAMPMFDDAIRQYPDDWYAWAGQGECFFKLDDLPKAEQSLRRAAQLSQQPRVNEEWQMVRQKMGLPSTSSQ
ncbi:MAG: tetratricopeptide repeat protein [Candidatus Acidiferrum sp.]